MSINKSINLDKKEGILGQTIHSQYSTLSRLRLDSLLQFYLLNDSPY